MSLYPVAERFISVNGEGRKAGLLACFIRLRGCNLCCNYCDTRWACEEACPVEYQSAEELVSWVKESGIHSVTLTGGEPLFREDAAGLLRTLAELPDTEIEVETNGSIPLMEYVGISERVFFTMDLKCPGSGMEEHNQYANLTWLRPQDVVKCVVSDRADLDWVRAKVEEYRLTDRCSVYIGAVFGRITPAEIVEYLKEYDMDQVHIQLQMHKYIWDPEKRGV